MKTDIHTTFGTSVQTKKQEVSLHTWHHKDWIKEGTLPCIT